MIKFSVNPAAHLILRHEIEWTRQTAAPPVRDVGIGTRWVDLLSAGSDP